MHYWITFYRCDCKTRLNRRQKRQPAEESVTFTSVRWSVVLSQDWSPRCSRVCKDTTEDVFILGPAARRPQPVARPLMTSDTWLISCPLYLHWCEMAHYQQTNRLAALSEHPLVDNKRLHRHRRARGWWNSELPTSWRQRCSSVHDEKGEGVTKSQTWEWVWVVFFCFFFLRRILNVTLNSVLTLLDILMFLI